MAGTSLKHRLMWRVGNGRVEGGGWRLEGGGWRVESNRLENRKPQYQTRQYAVVGLQIRDPA